MIPETESKPVGLRQQVLLAALECSGGDTTSIFTAEELLLSAWKNNPLAWGLRGHEREHPDSEKIYKELDRVTVAGKNVKGGLVGIGLFEKIRQRTYRFTPKGLQLAAQAAASSGDSSSTAKAERVLSDAISNILSHSIFREWQADSNRPRHFRDAGHFWGIAPGTPPSVIRARIKEVDDTLTTASDLLDSSGGTEISKSHGKVLFDRTDLDRARQFQQELKTRFSQDLKTLQVDLD